MKKRYNVNFGSRVIGIVANNRAQAARMAIKIHDTPDKNYSGKKANGQKDKIGWPLNLTITRED